MTPRPRTDRAFERLYRSHVRAVYRYALAVLPTPEDAEDVTQTTFLYAYRFRQDEAPTSLSTWLIGIAHDLCERRARRSAGMHQIPYEEESIDQTLSDDGDPSENDVRRALGVLPFQLRAVLIMRDVQARPYVEIAEILGVSLPHAESLIFRARRALREELEGALTCHEAERAMSRNLDGCLSRAERRALRAHARECDDCERLDRSQRAQRVALRALANVSLPHSLSSFFAQDDSGSGSLSRA